jgi:hypothetical protein
MKTILAGIAMVLLCGCFYPRDLQAEVVSAQLVKIDTINRYSNGQQQMLTWKDDYDIRYVSYASLNETFIVGTRMPMLRSTRLR